jgi:hypothetical protein
MWGCCILLMVCRARGNYCLMISLPGVRIYVWHKCCSRASFAILLGPLIGLLLAVFPSPQQEHGQAGAANCVVFLILHIVQVSIYSFIFHLCFPLFAPLYPTSYS